MTSPHIISRSFTPKLLAVLAATATAAIGLSAVAAPAEADPPVGNVGAVDPVTLEGTTGATAYANPDTPALRVVPVATSDELTSALSAAQPGDHIELARGTYTGPFTVNKSGTLENPIVVEAAPRAAVTLTATLHMPSCAAGGPDEDRTLSLVGDVSHFVLRGLTIDGGLRVSVKNANVVQNWQSRLITRHDWESRRAVPGTSASDPVAAREQIPWFQVTLGVPLQASEDVQILNNIITRKGVFGRLTTYSVLSGNVVRDVACGTGPGIWLANYSHGNVITGNVVTNVATSLHSHYMQEGIRLGNGSDYNALVGNIVRHLPVGGRGMTDDQDSSFNLFANNRVNDVDIAFNDQQSGWGNVWTHNIALNARKAAYSFRMEDAKLTAPSKDTSSWGTVVACNLAENSVLGLQVGGMAEGTFTGDEVTSVQIMKNVQGYWAAQGDTWDGSSTLPGGGSPHLTGC